MLLLSTPCDTDSDCSENEDANAAAQEHIEHNTARAMLSGCRCCGATD